MSRDHRKLRVFQTADASGEYRRFLDIAAGSSAETAYLLDISRRLGMLNHSDGERLEKGYAELTAGLKALLTSLERAGD